jgi:hypothetical protein
MAIDPTRIRRFEHGSRVPGWDEAADLEKSPAVVPDPATTPVPAELRAEIEDYMSRYPTSGRRRSRRCTRPSGCTAGARRPRSSRSRAPCG